tara:strand:+ start:832 stop:2055 length:1224 start_codon:yes stop_codon:yes gene_type:complete
MALINNLISNLGSKDPNKKLLSNVNDGQTTSTMEGQGFSDSQYDSMAQDFAFQANVKADKARNKLRTEYDRVDDVRSNVVKTAKKHNLGYGMGSTSDFGGNMVQGGTVDNPDQPSWRDSSGNQAYPTGLKTTFEGLTFNQPKGELLNESDIDSLTNTKMYGQGGGLTGAACNTYSCAIQREAGATIPKDFSYRRRVDGKMIHLKAGDPVPTLPSNEDMDNLYTKMGYEHVQLKDANLIHEPGVGTQAYTADIFDEYIYGDDQLKGQEAKEKYKSSIREVDNIKGGDIYRSGFFPSFMKDGSMKSHTTHSMTTGDQTGNSGFFDFYQNSGYMGSGLTTKRTSRQNQGTYLRYIGNTKDLKEKQKTTSFIANATRGNLVKPSKIKPMDGAQITASTTGLNSLFKKLKKK